MTATKNAASKSSKKNAAVAGSTATPPAEKKAGGKKNAAVPATNGKKKAAAAPVEKAATPRVSKRLRLFQLLAKNPGGLNNAEIRAALETSAIAAVCRDEAVYGRLRYETEEGGRRGKIWYLSKSGEKALSKGTVDSDAAPAAAWEVE